MTVLMGGDTDSLSLDFLPLLLFWPQLLVPAGELGVAGSQTLEAQEEVVTPAPASLLPPPRAASAGGTRGDLQTEGPGLYLNKKQTVEFALYG